MFYDTTTLYFESTNGEDGEVQLRVRLSLEPADVRRRWAHMDFMGRSPWAPPGASIRGLLDKADERHVAAPVRFSPGSFYPGPSGQPL